MKHKLLVIRDYLRSLMREPPFRLLFWALFHLPIFSVRLKATWSACERPQYLVGVLAAADQARQQGLSAISVIEFGVAAGVGLLILQNHAHSVEKATGVSISVFGFDTGNGLPALIGDYRDHPDVWSAGDYRMDEPALRRRLDSRSELILGDIAETVPRFIADATHPPVGFAAIDLDLYSSTREALKLLSAPDRRNLHRVFLYFDDILRTEHHSFAGESLAISEFNADNANVKIDLWRGLVRWNPFPDRSWLQQMFIAHDLEAISAYQPPSRPPLALRQLG